MKWTRSAVAALLSERGVHPRRALGQNFLVDENLLRAIVRDAGVGPGGCVIEIGSGLGNLTQALAAHAEKVFAFEIDESLLSIAREIHAGLKNVTWIHADGADFERFIPSTDATPLQVVANLPYRVYQRLLVALIGTRLPVVSCTLMLQEDAWVRIQARCATREYGPLSVWVQGACDIHRLRTVGRELFHPVPRVESVLVRLDRTRVLEPSLFPLLKRMFLQRRKKVPRWLLEGLPDPIRSTLDPHTRIEQLPPDRLIELAAAALDKDA